MPIGRNAPFGTAVGPQIEPRNLQPGVNPAAAPTPAGLRGAIVTLEVRNDRVLSLPAANGSAYARLSGPAAGQLWLVERVFSATGLTTFGYRLDFYGTEVDVNSVGGVAHQQEQIAMRAIDPNAIALDLSEVEFSPPLYVAGGNPFTIQWTGAPGHTFNDGQQVRAHVQYRVCALV